MKMPEIFRDATDTRLVLLFDSLPAEFEPHEGTWMLWPGRADGNWPGPTAQHTACAALAREIAEYEPITVFANAHQEQQARELLGTEVRVVEIAPGLAQPKRPGPALIANRDGEVRIVNWRRNAWNALCCNAYARWSDVDTREVDTTELEHGNGCVDTVSLQGASIRSDGDGTFFVAEESIANLQRASWPTRGEFAARLEDYCGARKVIWLPRGFLDERGTGRLDNLLAPVRPGVVALARVEDPHDPRCEIARQAGAILRDARDARNRRIQVMPLRIAPRMRSTYLNFQLCNGAVMLPTFDDHARDAEAMNSLRALFPGRRVVTVAARERDARAHFQPRTSVARQAGMEAVAGT